MYRASKRYSNPPFDKCLLLGVLMLLIPVLLFGQVRVEITAPDLQPGLAQVEARTQAEINDAAGEAAALVNGILRKPGLLRAVADATAGAGSLGLGVGTVAEGYLFAVGSAASVASESFSFQTVRRKLDDFQESDDIYLGGAVQPLLLTASIPAEKLLSGLRLGGALGYLTVESGPYEIIASSLSLSAGYQLLPPGNLTRYFDGRGVTILSSIRASRNRAATTLSPGVIEEEFTIDPDGEAGPIFGQEVSVAVEPEIHAELEGAAYSVGAGAVTGVDLLGFLGLTVGGMVEVVAGEAALKLSSDDEILLRGYLAGLLEEGGESRLLVSGGTKGVSPTLLHFSLHTALSWRVGSYLLSLPVAWRSNSGVAGGVFLGITL